MIKRIFFKRLLLITVALFANKISKAQLCQGSLGDPVVNITFGAGENFGAALKSTNYTFVSNTCPDDGSYTIANSTSNCFGGTWHTVPEDHTPGDIKGYMMIVNASFNPGDFYLDTVKNLCGGTTYEFAAWVLNVLQSVTCSASGIKPNITFSIESTTGVVLQTYSTGDIDANSSPVWKQYGLFFTTPSAINTVVVRMTNNAPGGCGNDILLDDITFRPCGPKIAININGASNTINLCEGDNATFNFTSNIVAGYANNVYQWQSSRDSIMWTDITGANNNTYSFTGSPAAGKYFYRLAVADGSNITISSCRIASDPASINVNSLPVPLASNNGPKCSGDALTINAAGGGSYSWTGPGNFISNARSPVIQNSSVNNSGTYYVQVISESGCINNDSTKVIINLSPVANAGNDIDICEGGTTKLQGSGVRATSFIWSPTDGLSDPFNPTTSASPAITTTYVLTVDDGKCKNSDSVLVKVLKTPVANAGADKAIIQGQSVTLDGEAGGGNITYFWTPDQYISSSSELKPKASPPKDITYTLHVLSNIGCGIATDEVTVSYYKEFYIPNAFTPNNDGINDRWNLPVLPAFPFTEVSVYNRYGQLVFYSKGVGKQWDGRFKGIDQPPGVYLYMVDLKNGLNKIKGALVLIR